MGGDVAAGPHASMCLLFHDTHPRLCLQMTFFSLRWIGAKFDNRKLLLLGSVMITGGCILLQNYYVTNVVVLCGLEGDGE